MDGNRYDVSSSYLVLLQPDSQESPGQSADSPGRLRHDSLLEIESPGRSRRDGLPRIGSLGRSRCDDLLGLLELADPQGG